MGFVAHRVVILSKLVKKNNVPDGSIFATLWRTFLRHLAHFHEPRGSGVNLLFTMQFFLRKPKQTASPQ